MRGQFETPGADDAAAYQLGALAADVALVAGWLSAGHDGPAASPGGLGGGASAPGGGGVHLLGHSLGGLVAREVLLARAAQISSLTLMSSGPGALSGPRALILQALLAELDGVGPDRLGAEVERIWRTRLEPEARGRERSPGDHRLPGHPAAEQFPHRAAHDGADPAHLPGPDCGPGPAGFGPADGRLRRERRRVGPRRPGGHGRAAAGQADLHTGRGALPRGRGAGDRREHPDQFLERDRVRSGPAVPLRLASLAAVSRRLLPPGRPRGGGRRWPRSLPGTPRGSRTSRSRGPG